MTRFLPRPALGLAAALSVFGAAGGVASEGGGKAAEGGGKTTAFGPEEQSLQLAPLWVPVTGARSQTKGVPGFRPVTIKITSQAGGMMTMCYRLPYIIEGFLFEMNRQPISQLKNGRLDLAGVNGRLLAVAGKAAGPGAVKTVEAIDGAPHPDKANQGLLALCQ
jgi:hypothetical protein